MNLMVEWFVINALTVYKMELFKVLTDFIKSKCFFKRIISLRRIMSVSFY